MLKKEMKVRCTLMSQLKTSLEPKGKKARPTLSTEKRKSMGRSFKRGELPSSATQAGDQVSSGKCLWMEIRTESTFREPERIRRFRNAAQEKLALEIASCGGRPGKSH